MKTGSILLALALVLWGCARPPWPRETRARLELPASFSHPPSGSPRSLLERPWWEAWGDERLSALIEEALQKNARVEQAVARLLEARAYLQAERAGLFPALKTSYSLERSSRPGYFGRDTGTNYRGALSVRYELDLWGKIRSGASARAFEANATLEDLRALYITLSGEVAAEYYRIATLKAQEEKARNKIEILSKELHLLEGRYSLGLVPAEEVLRARTELEQARKALSDLRSEKDTASHRLAVLLGRWPNEPPLPEPAGLPDLEETLPVGIPSDLLEMRPDVRAAYLRLKAVDSEAAEAAAEIFPSVNLLAEIGRSRSVFGGLALAGTFWSEGVETTLTLFEGGRKWAAVKGAKARAMEALSAWRASVLQAFKEVEDALAQAEAADEAARRLEALRSSLLELERKAEADYALGLSDALGILRAKSGLLDADSRLLDARYAQIGSRIRLFKALGGGWPKTVRLGEKS